MDHFKDKVAIVTGGASGIGQALCEELGRRGAAGVVVADVNVEGAHEVAAAITAVGGRAQAAELDVTQAEAVQALVEQTASQHGRLDLMFNNAGISTWGEMRDMTLDHWQRIVDVNLWGVIYGTMSAYGVMVGQGFGHIVNTASSAGLAPSPFATAYVTTKHGVVGLSTTLRVEGVGLGVKVSVVCPGFIRTGIGDAMEFVTQLEGGTKEFVAAAIPKMMEPDDCARVILRGVERNKAIITVTGLARVAWWLNRLNPGLMLRLSLKMVSDTRAMRVES